MGTARSHVGVLRPGRSPWGEPRPTPVSHWGRQVRVGALSSPPVCFRPPAVLTTPHGATARDVASRPSPPARTLPTAPSLSRGCKVNFVSGDSSWFLESLRRVTSCHIFRQRTSAQQGQPSSQFVQISATFSAAQDTWGCHLLVAGTVSDVPGSQRQSQSSDQEFQGPSSP